MAVVYPNPAKSTVTITTENGIDQVIIFDTNGKTVLKSNNERVNVEHLQSGIYFLQAYKSDVSLGIEKLVIF